MMTNKPISMNNNNEITSIMGNNETLYSMSSNRNSAKSKNEFEMNSDETSSTMSNKATS